MTVYPHHREGTRSPAPQQAPGVAYFRQPTRALTRFDLWSNFYSRVEFLAGPGKKRAPAPTRRRGAGLWTLWGRSGRYAAFRVS
jgi:hypothetical protein